MIQTEKNDTVTTQDGWLNALSFDKLTTTVSRINRSEKDLFLSARSKGMKVVAGSLDVLETVGKKTFDVKIDERKMIYSNGKSFVFLR